MRALRLALIGVAFALGLRCGAAEAQEIGHTQMDHADHAHAVDDGAPPRTPIPALTDADRLASQPPSTMHMDHDDAMHSHTRVDQIEIWNADHDAGLGWEAEGWIGGDINRLWWRTRGKHIDGRTSTAELQALFGHSVSPRWDWVAGLRQDFRPRTARSFIALGLQGLAPQWFEVSAMAYLGEGGRTAARLSIGYTLLLTNRLMLQPVLDVDAYGKDDAARRIGSGLSTAETGLRLRYEITRQFAPYVGITWERAFGDTAGLQRAAGDAAHDMRLVAGIRLWF